VLQQPYKAALFVINLLSITLNMHEISFVFRRKQLSKKIRSSTISFASISQTAHLSTKGVKYRIWDRLMARFNDSLMCAYGDDCELVDMQMLDTKNALD
jgi:hypothetical protein